MRRAGHHKCPNCRKPFEKPRKRCNPSDTTDRLLEIVGLPRLTIATRRRSVLDDNDLLTSERPRGYDPPKFTKIKKNYSDESDDESETEEEEAEVPIPDPSLRMTRTHKTRRIKKVGPSRRPKKPSGPPSPQKERRKSLSPTPPPPSNRDWNRQLDDYDSFLENMTDEPFFRFMRSNVIHEARRRKPSSDSPQSRRGKST